MKKTYFHKLGRIGGQETSSHYVTIPSELIEELGWSKGRIIAIEKLGKKITFEAYRSPKRR